MSREITGTHEFNGACIGAVNFRTNGPQGGDGGHGGFLEITLTNRASVSMDVTVDGQKFETTDAVTLTFSGDSEMDYALEALEFVVSKLKAARALGYY